MGNTVDLDIGPFLVRFTSDGRFAVVNAMLLGTDIRGTVSSIRLEQSTSPGGKPHHALVSRVEAGFQPEGLTISPDEHWIATTNLEHSTFPLADPRQGFFSSVSLLRFDAATGILSRVGEFPFDGRLPEAAVFDNSSRFWQWPASHITIAPNQGVPLLFGGSSATTLIPPGRA